jgi:hypothetical protein
MITYRRAAAERFAVRFHKISRDLNGQVAAEMPTKIAALEVDTRKVSRLAKL